MQQVLNNWIYQAFGSQLVDNPVVAGVFNKDIFNIHREVILLNYIVFSN